MKSIAAFAATLVLGAGAAMAAPPSQPATVPPATHQPAVSHHAMHHQAAAVRAADAARETQALNLLEAKGYGSFTNFRAAGNDFAATVNKDGHSMNVRVDPQKGSVTTEG